MTLGFLEEAASFMEWIERRCESATPGRDIMIMYTVDGSEDIDETILDHLEGYQGSRPVRIGNGAVHQRQIDVYGELMDSVYLYNREVPISYDLWVAAAPARGCPGPRLAGRGDLRTVALVGTDGTVDWYCPSRFDAPSLFGALLDARKGGYFSLSSRSNGAPEAAVPARHEHPADPLSRRRGGRRSDRLHGAGHQQYRPGP